MVKGQGEASPGEADHWEMELLWMAVASQVGLATVSKAKPA